jgi:hypothetical protein
MIRINLIAAYSSITEFLNSTFPPNAVGNAEHGVFLGWAFGHPFLSQLKMQFLKFSWIFSWKDRSLGERSMFEGVRNFASVTHCGLCCSPSAEAAKTKSRPSATALRAD